MPAASPPSPVLPLISIPPTPPTTTAPSQVLSNEDVTLTDTTLAVSVLNTLDGHTSPVPSMPATSTTLTGSNAADTDHRLRNTGFGISNLGNEAVSVAAAPPPPLSGQHPRCCHIRRRHRHPLRWRLATLAGLTETGNAYTITITDTSVDAAALNTLDGKTTVAINAANITTLTGAAADLNTAYDSNGITGLDDEDVTLSDTTLDAAVLNTLDGNTSGAIDANTITTLSGSASDLITAYASNGIQPR